MKTIINKRQNVQEKEIEINFSIIISFVSEIRGILGKKSRIIDARKVISVKNYLKTRVFISFDNFRRRNNVRR